MSLNPKQIKFIDKFINEGQDPIKAAISAGYKESYGKTLYAMPEVRSEIDFRLKVLNTEKAKQTSNTELGQEVVKLRKIIKEEIDHELHSLMTVDVTKTPQLGPTKMAAIDMSYRRIGVIAGGEFIPDPDESRPKEVSEAPRIFRSTQREILTHTIETTKTVQQLVREDVPEPKMIEGKCPYEF